MSHSNVIDRPPVINQPPISEKPRRPQKFTVFFNQTIQGLAPNLITILCRDFRMSGMEAMQKHQDVLKGGNISLFISSREVCESKAGAANEKLLKGLVEKPETIFSSFGFTTLHHPILN